MKAYVAYQQRGFTIIEVLVAAVLIGFTAVIISTFVVRSSHSQTVAKVRQQQAGIAEMALEKINGSDAWSRATECQNVTSSCDIIPYVFKRGVKVSDVPRDAEDIVMWQGEAQKVLGGYAYRYTDPESKIIYMVTASAEAFDQAADGVGPKDDTDGTPVDMFKVSVTVQQDRAASVEPYVLTTNISPLLRYRFGSLKAKACMVDYQIDERLSVSSCGGESYLDSPAQLRVNNGLGVIEGGECGEDLTCRAWVCAHPSADIFNVCADRSGSYNLLNSNSDVRKAAGQFVKTKALSIDGLGYQMSGVEDTVTSGEERIGSVTGDKPLIKLLLPGMWNIEFTTPANTERWDSHSAPSQGAVSVAPGMETPILQMFQPLANRTFSVRYRKYDSTTGTVDSTTFSPTFPICLRLVPAPADRAPTLPLSQEVCGKTGESTLVFTGLAPGLYSLQPLGAKTSSTWKWEFFNTPGFIWIGSGSGVDNGNYPPDNTAFIQLTWASDPCANVVETPGFNCVDGELVADLCYGVTVPDGFKCISGELVANPPPPPSSTSPPPPPTSPPPPPSPPPPAGGYA